MPYVLFPIFKEYKYTAYSVSFCYSCSFLIIALVFPFFLVFTSESKIFNYRFLDICTYKFRPTDCGI